MWLTTKHNDFGMAVELVGLPVHAALDPGTPLSFVTRVRPNLRRRAASVTS
jgi:hypothetical protein